MTGPYNERPPFVAGSDTSEAAADSVEFSSLILREKVFALFERYPPGLTCDEVEQMLDYRHQSISARVRELSLTNRIHDCGRRRKTRSGRFARIYMLGPQPEPEPDDGQPDEQLEWRDFDADC